MSGDKQGETCGTSHLNRPAFHQPPYNVSDDTTPGDLDLTPPVKAPPMVGPTWTRVRLTLGLGCLPVIVLGDCLASFSLSFYAFLFARTCPMFNDIGLY